MVIKRTSGERPQKIERIKISADTKAERKVLAEKAHKTLQQDVGTREKDRAIVQTAPPSSYVHIVDFGPEDTPDPRVETVKSLLTDLGIPFSVGSIAIDIMGKAEAVNKFQTNSVKFLISSKEIAWLEDKIFRIKQLPKTNQNQYWAEVGKMLKSSRNATGLTQIRFSHETGINHATLCAYERGAASGMSASTLLKFCIGLKVSPKRLFKNQGQENR